MCTQAYVATGINLMIPMIIIILFFSFFLFSFFFSSALLLEEYAKSFCDPNIVRVLLWLFAKFRSAM